MAASRRPAIQDAFHRPRSHGGTVWRLDMFRDLLVHVDGGQAGRRRVQFAVALAGRMGARLSGLHVTPPADVPPLYKPSRVVEVAAEISSELALDAREAATTFSEEATRRLANACWFEAAGDVVEGISDKARYADLIILGQYERQGSPERHPLPIAHSVVLRCGRPVLVVPAEPVRAVHDALPLLRLSRSVQIVTMIRPSVEDNEVDAKSLLAHLFNHGIKVGTVLQIRTAEEHESLRKQIEQGHYDLLVMGGYSHPMWLEFIFGGATRSI